MADTDKPKGAPQKAAPRAEAEKAEAENTEPSPAEAERMEAEKAQAAAQEEQPLERQQREQEERRTSQDFEIGGVEEEDPRAVAAFAERQEAVEKLTAEQSASIMGTRQEEPSEA
jgi:hypothetical protein